MSSRRNFKKPLPLKVTVRPWRRAGGLTGVCHIRVRSLLAALLVPGLLAGCSGGVLSPVGPIGSAERTILLNSVLIMLAIVIPVIVATLAFAWWFRASNRRARYLPTFAYSGRIELIIWSIPALVVFFLGGIAWIGSHDLDPAQPLPSTHKALEVDVVSLDWKWLFIYPEQGVASVNRLVAPIGVPLHLRITSATVLNVFFVPRLGSEIYAMNGMATELNLQADEPGVFFGLAAHFSGDGFSDMNFEMQAVSPAEFAAWTTTTSGTGPELDDTSYRKLLKQTENVTPYTYRTVQAGLFDAILTQKLPPGEGPQTGSPSASVSPATTEN